MAEPESITSEPTSPFWSRVKILMGFAPALVALGTAITAIVKVYDQSSQKAVYETLGKRVDENSSAIQDTHSDVKAVWAYLNGMAIGKSTSVEVCPPKSPVLNQETRTSTSSKQKVNSFASLAKKFSTPESISSSLVDQDEIPDTKDSGPEQRVQFSVAQEAPIPHKALPEMSQTPKSEKLPSFEDVIEKPKLKK